MASDRIVSAKDVLDALLRLQRTGPDPLIHELEQCEPDLCEYLLEQTSALHQSIARMGARPARTRRLTRHIEQMALVLVFALRNAHLRLWQEEHVDTPLAELDQSIDPSGTPGPDG